MDVNQISMDKHAAMEKYTACINENHADSYEFNQQCAQAYEALAEGHKLLRLSHSIRQAGLGEDGRPKLAVARADRKEVFFDWRWSPVARFCSAANTGSWSAGRWPELNIRVDMQQSPESPVSGFTLVPGVPADVRPKTGQLNDWFILWEVDEWADRSRHGLSPGDPILLKHIGGDLYAVLAEWDLTPVEQAVLEGLNN